MLALPSLAQPGVLASPALQQRRVCHNGPEGKPGKQTRKPRRYGARTEHVLQYLMLLMLRLDVLPYLLLLKYITSTRAGCA